MELYPELRQLMPRTCSIQVASRLCGLGTAAFKGCLLDTGKIETDPETGKPLMHSIAAALGRAITHKEWLAANRSLDGRREVQRKYAARKRSTVWKVH